MNIPHEDFGFQQGEIRFDPVDTPPQSPGTPSTKIQGILTYTSSDGKIKKEYDVTLENGTTSQQSQIQTLAFAAFAIIKDQLRPPNPTVEDLQKAEFTSHHYSIITTKGQLVTQEGSPELKYSTPSGSSTVIGRANQVAQSILSGTYRPQAAAPAATGGGAAGSAATGGGAGAAATTPHTPPAATVSHGNAVGASNAATTGNPHQQAVVGSAAAAAATAATAAGAVPLVRPIPQPFATQPGAHTVTPPNSAPAAAPTASPPPTISVYPGPHQRAEVATGDRANASEHDISGMEVRVDEVEPHDANAFWSSDSDSDSNGDDNFFSDNDQGHDAAATATGATIRRHDNVASNSESGSDSDVESMTISMDRHPVSTSAAKGSAAATTVATPHAAPTPTLTAASAAAGAGAAGVASVPWNDVYQGLQQLFDEKLKSLDFGKALGTEQLASQAGIIKDIKHVFTNSLKESLRDDLDCARALSKAKSAALEVYGSAGGTANLDLDAVVAPHGDFGNIYESLRTQQTAQRIIQSRTASGAAHPGSAANPTASPAGAARSEPAAEATAGATPAGSLPNVQNDTQRPAAATTAAKAAQQARLKEKLKKAYKRITPESAAATAPAATAASTASATTPIAVVGSAAPAPQSVMASAAGVTNEAALEQKLKSQLGETLYQSLSSLAFTSKLKDDEKLQKAVKKSFAESLSTGKNWDQALKEAVKEAVGSYPTTSENQGIFQSLFSSTPEAKVNSVLDKREIRAQYREAATKNSGQSAAAAGVSAPTSAGAPTQPMVAIMVAKPAASTTAAAAAPALHPVVPNAAGTAPVNPPISKEKEKEKELVLGTLNSAIDALTFVATTSENEKVKTAIKESFFQSLVEKDNWKNALEKAITAGKSALPQQQKSEGFFSKRKKGPDIGEQIRLALTTQSRNPKDTKIKETYNNRLRNVPSVSQASDSHPPTQTSERAGSTSSTTSKKTTSPSSTTQQQATVELDQQIQQILLSLGNPKDIGQSKNVLYDLAKEIYESYGLPENLRQQLEPKILRVVCEFINSNKTDTKKNLDDLSQELALQIVNTMNSKMPVVDKAIMLHSLTLKIKQAFVGKAKNLSIEGVFPTIHVDNTLQDAPKQGLSGIADKVLSYFFDDQTFSDNPQATNFNKLCTANNIRNKDKDSLVPLKNKMKRIIQDALIKFCNEREETMKGQPSLKDNDVYPRFYSDLRAQLDENFNTLFPHIPRDLSKDDLEQIKSTLLTNLATAVEVSTAVNNFYKVIKKDVEKLRAEQEDEGKQASSSTTAAGSSAAAAAAPIPQPQHSASTAAAAADKAAAGAMNAEVGAAATPASPIIHGPNAKSEGDKKWKGDQPSASAGFTGIPTAAADLTSDSQSNQPTAAASDERAGSSQATASAASAATQSAAPQVAAGASPAAGTVSPTEAQPETAAAPAAPPKTAPKPAQQATGEAAAPSSEQVVSAQAGTASAPTAGTVGSPQQPVAGQGAAAALTRNRLRQRRNALPSPSLNIPPTIHEDEVIDLATPTAEPSPATESHLTSTRTEASTEEPITRSRAAGMAAATSDSARTNAGTRPNLPRAQTHVEGARTGTRTTPQGERPLDRATSMPLRSTRHARMPTFDDSELSVLLKADEVSEFYKILVSVVNTGLASTTFEKHEKAQNAICTAILEAFSRKESIDEQGFYANKILPKINRDLGGEKINIPESRIKAILADTRIVQAFTDRLAAKKPEEAAASVAEAAPQSKPQPTASSATETAASAGAGAAASGAAATVAAANSLAAAKTAPGKVDKEEFSESTKKAAEYILQKDFLKFICELTDDQIKKFEENFNKEGFMRNLQGIRNQEASGKLDRETDIHILHLYGAFQKIFDQVFNLDEERDLRNQIAGKLSPFFGIHIGSQPENLLHKKGGSVMIMDTIFNPLTFAKKVDEAKKKAEAEAKAAVATAAQAASTTTSPPPVQGAAAAAIPVTAAPANARVPNQPAQGTKAAADARITAETVKAALGDKEFLRTQRERYFHDKGPERSRETNVGFRSPEQTEARRLRREREEKEEAESKAAAATAAQAASTTTSPPPVQGVAAAATPVTKKSAAEAPTVAVAPVSKVAAPATRRGARIKLEGVPQSSKEQTPPDQPPQSQKP